MTTDPALMGDPHMGRAFTRGVPLARRGVREQLVRDAFVAALDPRGARVHICLGDLFDKPVVPYEDLLFVLHAYEAAACEHPGTTFYVIQGNHDKSRDADATAAWDVFCWIMQSRCPNVVCVTETFVGPEFAIFPWHPTKTAAEMVREADELIAQTGCTRAYGHWDTDPRSESHNLVPTRELADVGIGEVWTGHVHKPERFTRDAVTVHVVGSLQPYAQGEDGGQGSVRYVTLTADDPRLHEPGALANCCVRLQLRPGEAFEEEIPDCLSWDVQRVQSAEEAPPADVSMEGFDVGLAFQRALEDYEICAPVREEITARWLETTDHAG